MNWRNFHSFTEENVLLIVGVPPSLWLHQIGPRPITIGRAASCEATVYHVSVSRRHAEIWSDGSMVYVRDLDSSNGTFVGNKRISEAAVPSGSELRAASVRLRAITREQFAKEWRAHEEPSTFLPVDSQESREHTDVGMSRRADLIQELSETQLRVLRLLLIGLGERDVAAKLFVSPNTVHTHVKAIYKVFHVTSRAALMAEFIDHAVIRNPEKVGDQKETWRAPSYE